ncbi:restriction endonuclease subunit S [Stutzerimonas kunmingensis]|uniref:restriction endonuclease subunit S n=1 Tax=Stutzerimonas kunmingensis TaxID=1211807 RepID=UPI00289CBEE5|nr:restriction endonuclease subunit S [Stutzerimonas kunmingensis]
MSEISWPTRSIRECLADSFAGEWGAEPLPGNARVLRATDIDNDGHITGAGASRRLPIGKLASRQLEDGDILLEGSGGGPEKPVGRVAFFDAAEHQGPAVCSNFFKTLRPEQRVVEPRFLWRKLMWFYRQPTLLTFQQQTTGIINLKFEEYLNADIEVPADLAEQRAIAQILDTLDTAICETEALIGKLKAVKQGLLHDLLTRGIDANGQLRPPQSEAPQLYKESPLGWIPKEWDTEPIINLTSNSVIGPFGSDLVAADYRDSGVPVIFVRDVKPDRLVWKSNVFVSASKAQALAAHEVRAGDVVATKMGFPPCVAAVYPESMSSGIVTADIVRLRPCTDRICSDWMSMFINSSAVAKQVEQITAGVTRPKVTLRDVRNLLIGLPPLKEQERVLDRLTAMQSRIQLEETSHEKLTAKKAGLMDDLLTGRVRVTPLLESVQQLAAQTGA